MQKSIEPNDKIREYLKIVANRESFWSRKWVEDGVFEADPEEGRDKVFITFPYPYMNGSLHLGHAYSSGRLDVLARYYRMKGYNVLYPWAWHWTGEAVLGTIHRLLDGDISVRKRLIELDGVDEELIDKFKDPVFFVRYFTNVNREVVKRYGLSIDWRREFHTSSLHPLYNKFVEWQIRKLYKKGYIGKGLYPAVWCPRDQSPTGDHDRLEGVGVRPEEYTLIKFKLYLDDTEYYLVAGTFRPETIYGVTNIWVNPDTDYVVAEVDSEKWIISKEAAFKLENQLKTVKIIEEFKGSYIVGLFAEAPLVNKYIPILPARFVDPDMVTGVVYSVPGHAPYDYLALRDITDSRNIDPIIKEMASRIKPLSIIKVEGYGDYPAIEIVEEMGIKSQEDYEKADEATQKIYKIEYHRGVMKENCGPISNMPVSKAKEIIKSILLEEGLATTMYDLPEKVVCRCGTKCIVKIITDQWYLKYSDPTWKKIAYEALNNMKIYPDEAKKLFDHYIDWYEDWPCTRKTGLGTPFPFDKDWIVETLTDSTVYMAFYIIAKYYNKGIINVDKVDDSFFEYIFYGSGDPNELSKTLNIDRAVLDEIRSEFLYWYPVDVRGSGKDLIGNHLTFYIFHHVALFPADKWPRSITVNGYVMLNGRPMSKSAGNYISLENAIKAVGSDALRLSLLTLADGLEDPDWSLDKGYKALERLYSIEEFIKNVYSINDDTQPTEASYHDKLLLARYYTILDSIEKNISEHKIGQAGREIFYKLFDVFREYLKVAEKPNYILLKRLLRNYIKLLSLYAPLTAEDLWHNVLGEDSYISLETWPEVDRKYVNDIILLAHEYGSELRNDILHVYRLIPQPESKKKIIVMVASRWKWELIKDQINNKTFNISKFINDAVKMGVSNKAEAARVAGLIKKEWFGRYEKFRDLIKYWSQEDEINFIKTVFKDYIKHDIKDVELSVYDEENPPSETVFKKEPLPLYPAFVII